MGMSSLRQKETSWHLNGAPEKSYNVGTWTRAKRSIPGDRACVAKAEEGTEGARQVWGRQAWLRQTSRGRARGGREEGTARGCRGPGAEILFMLHTPHALRSLLPFQRPNVNSTAIKEVIQRQEWQGSL